MSKFPVLISLIVGVFSSVINTGNLDTVSYGDVRYVYNIMSFFGGLLLFGYFVSGSRLLAISKTESNSRNIRGAMIVILGVAIIAMLVIMLLVSFVHSWYLSNSKIALLFLFALPVCATPLLQSYVNTVLQGDNKITALALSHIAPSIIYVLVAYWIYTRYGATSTRMLLLQYGIATIVYLIIIFLGHPSFKDFADTYNLLKKENNAYGWPVYCGSIANVTLGYLAGITLGIFGENNENVGFYTLALTVSSPLTMLPSVVGTTYFKQFALVARINPKIIFFTFILSLLSLLIFIVIIHPVVCFLYKESYSSVANYASFLAIGMTLHGIGDMYNRFLGAHGLGKELRNAAFLAGGILLFGNIVFVYIWGIRGAIVTRILASGSYGVFLGFRYFVYLKKN